MQRLRGHTDRVYGISFHPDEPVLASGSADFTVRLWAPPAMQRGHGYGHHHGRRGSARHGMPSHAIPRAAFIS